MKKSLISLTRIILIVATLIASCVIINQPVQADAGPGPDPTISGVGPYQPRKTNVQMLSETVIIELPSSSQTPNQDKIQFNVKASFTMQNQSEIEETMQVIFPLTRPDTPWDNGRYDIVSSSFAVKVNGQAMPITEITTPSEMTTSPYTPSSDGKFYPDVRWAAFEATFPIHQEVLLEVEYNMRGGGGFTGIDYILETGAGWYGNILSADIILRLPYPVTNEVIKEANAGYVLSGNEIQWKMKNFEPTRKDNITVSVVNSSNWFSIMQLRSKVEQNPNDADSWYELGDQYTNLAIRFLAVGCEYIRAYDLSSTHLAGLAAQAYEKAIELRPNWGDAHLQLANILWFGNENVNKLFDYPLLNQQSNEVQPFKLDDLYVQRILKEIDLALSYKVTNEYYACRLYSYINKAIPELKLTLPATETVTPKPPIKTPTPTSTSTSIASVIPTQVPTPKADSTTSVYGLSIVVLVFLGIFVYFRVYRVKIQK